MVRSWKCLAIILIEEIVHSLWKHGAEKGDTVFSTDDKYIIKGTQREALPVVCLQKSASKQLCDEQSFIEADKILIKGDVEDVGTVTNRATNIESYKANFPKDSKEWQELDYRVQACIAISQSSINLESN